MSNVVSLPTALRVDENTRGSEVIVAPRGHGYAAWVRTDRGFAILEDAPDYQHVLLDGQRYAERHDLPFWLHREPLDPSVAERPALAGGKVEVWPSERHGGSWDVVLWPEAGDSVGTIGNRFSLDQAVAEGRRLAAEFGARFLDNQQGAPVA